MASSRGPCWHLDGSDGGRIVNEWKELTDEDRQAVVDSMPGALDGFLRGWGWQQFAKAVEQKLRDKNDPTPYCVECGDGITPHDPGICGCCYATKYSNG